MITNIITFKLEGLNAVKTTTEVSIEGGIGIHLIGLADISVKESLLRTVTALQANGYTIPGKRTIINLVPADLHKSGSGFDLPIALGVIDASGQKSLPFTADYAVLGELGLGGEVRYVSGGIIVAQAAKALGLKGIVLPAESAKECTDLDGIEVYGVRTLSEAISVFEHGAEGNEHLLVYGKGDDNENDKPSFTDLADIPGNEGAKRAIEIAAAGGHNIVLVGAEDSGKASLVKALAGILPPMTRDEAAKVSEIYSRAGRYGNRTGLLRNRPIRAPHYSASIAAFIGGGGDVLPGEVSLAHNGVFFLDECELAPISLRAALKVAASDRSVTIRRLQSKVMYPSHFSLVLGMAPCPCGHYGDGTDRCTCSPRQRRLFLEGAADGSLFEEIAIHAYTRPAKASGKSAPARETSAQVAERVAAARKRQEVRYRDVEGISLNDDVPSKDLDRYIPVDDGAAEMLERITVAMNLSARSYSEIIRIARTIADLAGKEEILPTHIAEAASYRFLDKLER